jgi:hypothetical protein
LLVLFIERVEGVEERFLGLDLVLQELDVVDQEDVILAVALLELEWRVVPHRVYKVVRKLLARDVPDPHAWVLVLHIMSYGAQQMGLPQTHTAVDKEWVVDEARGLCDSERSRVGEPVARPYDERIERVLGPERSRRTHVQNRLGALSGRAVPGVDAWSTDADHQGGLLAYHIVEHLLQKGPEAALDVLLGERVGDGYL